MDWKGLKQRSLCLYLMVLIIYYDAENRISTIIKIQNNFLENKPGGLLVQYSVLRISTCSCTLSVFHVLTACVQILTSVAVDIADQ